MYSPPPTIQERKQTFDAIVSALRREKESIPESSSITTFFNLKKRIGGKSRFAETHQASIRNLPDTDVALKVMPVTSDPSDTRIDWSVKEVVKEIRILDALCSLVERHISQNVPLTFDTLVCFNCRYANPSLRNKDAPTSCVVIPNELADGDLLHWMTSQHSPDEWKSCIFQVISGLSAAQEHLGIIHADLHDGNMLFTNVSPGGYWHYRFVVDGRSSETYDYYVPNAGQLWKLWDFGQSKMRVSHTRENRRRMWEDSDRAIGDFMMGRFYASKKSDTITMDLPPDDHQTLRLALDRSKKHSRFFPAFELLRSLGWYSSIPREGTQLNTVPFTVQVTTKRKYSVSKRQTT